MKHSGQSLQKSVTKFSFVSETKKVFFVKMLFLLWLPSQDIFSHGRCKFELNGQFWQWEQKEVIFCWLGKTKMIKRNSLIMNVVKMVGFKFTIILLPHFYTIIYISQSKIGFTKTHLHHPPKKPFLTVVTAYITITGFNRFLRMIKLNLFEV